MNDSRQTKPTAPVIHVGQMQIRYLRDGTPRGEMGTFELTVPPGSNVPPPHSYGGNDEFVYVLEGTLRYRVGEEVRDLAPGDFMFTPRGHAACLQQSRRRALTRPSD